MTSTIPIITTFNGCRAKALRVALVGLSVSWSWPASAEQPPTDPGGVAEAATAQAPQQSPAEAIKAEMEALQLAVEEAEKTQTGQIAPEQSVSTYQQQRAVRAAQQEARLQKIRNAQQSAVQKAQASQPAQASQSEGAVTDIGAPQSAAPPHTQVTSKLLPVIQDPGPPHEPMLSRGALAELSILFQLDHLQGPKSQPDEPWVPRISGVLDREFTVLAKVEGHDAAGRAIDINPEWISADPSRVVIAPAKGQTVKITVRGAGASNLTVMASGISKDLLISAARDQRNGMRVEILQ